MKRFALSVSVWLLLIRATAAATCAGPGFVAPDRYALPGPSAAIASGDFNNDGRLDLATLARTDGDGISVLIGKADGTFEDAVSSGGPEPASLIATGDFNADNKLDIVAAGNFAIRLYLGNGDGTFQTGVEISNHTASYALTVADVDGDGNADVIFPDNTNNVIQVLLGNGDGSFASPLTVDDSANAIAFAKVDAGDTLDLILTGGHTLGVTIYPGNGDGTFGSPIFLTPPGDFFVSVRAADLNSDGKTDIVTINGFWVTTFLGHGDGTFDAGVNSSAGNIPWELTLADFTDDGFPDIVVAEYDRYGGSFGSPFLLILIGQGDGTFVMGRSYVTGQGPTPVAVGDFGNEGHEDFATVDTTSPGVFVFGGQGDGSFRGVLLIPGGEFFTTDLATGDYDEDGRADVAELVNFSGSLIFVNLLNTDLTIRDSFEYSLPGARTLSSADYDGDGHLDLLTIRGDPRNLLFLRGHGDGSFDGPVTAGAAPEAEFFDITTGDFDGDGHPDLAIVTQNAYHDLGAVWILLGNGDGTFRQAGTIPLFLAPTRLLAADFDPDGLADLAVVGGNSMGEGQLLILRSLGNGSFEATATYDIDPSPTAIVVGDFVEDGIPDLAILAGRATIYQGYAGGGFSPVAQVEAAGYLLTQADFNGDGHLDLATERSLLIGSGDGNVVLLQTYQAGTSASAIASGDLDGDGLPDAVVGQFSGGGYSILHSARGVAVEAPGSAIIGTQARLTVSTVGFASPTFQWRKNGDPILDGGTISGATTSALTIDPVSFADAGVYDVVVTDGCGSTVSGPGTVAVDFADVPASNIFRDDIIRVANHGVTAGCGGSDYCPTSPVRRDQMAVFLLKSEHGPDYAPPACTGTFADVPCSSTFAPWIEQLANEGVTAGCGGGNYCPGDAITRAQVAIFLLKTSQGSAFVPPPASGFFGDVPPGVVRCRLHRVPLHQRHQRRMFHGPAALLPGPHSPSPADGSAARADLWTVLSVATDRLSGGTS